MTPIQSTFEFTPLSEAHPIYPASSPPLTAVDSVLIQALQENSASVYVGKAGVTAATGWQLPPGGVICLPVENPSTIFAICQAAGQRLRVMVL